MFSLFCILDLNVSELWLDRPIYGYKLNYAPKAKRKLVLEICGATKTHSKHPFPVYSNWKRMFAALISVPPFSTKEAIFNSKLVCSINFLYTHKTRLPGEIKKSENKFKWTAKASYSKIFVYMYVAGLELNFFTTSYNFFETRLVYFKSISVLILQMNKCKTVRPWKTNNSQFF